MTLSPAAYHLVLMSPYSNALWADLSDILAKDCTLHIVPSGRTATLTGLAEKVLKTAPPRFFFAGLCLGAHVGYEVLRRAPDRLLGLAAINASASVDSAAQREMRRLRIDKLRTKARTHTFPDAVYVEQAAHWLISPRAKHPLTVLETARNLVAQVPVAASLAQQLALSGRCDSRRDLASSRVPVIVAGGRDDRICPPETLLSLRETAPHVPVHIINDCGHLAPVEQPERLASILITWLSAARKPQNRKELIWTI